MKCLNCGKETQNLLCDTCKTPEILDKIFKELCYFRPLECTNPYLVEFAYQTTKNSPRDSVSDLLRLFDSSITDFYYCRFYSICRNPRFEALAIAYLQSHNLEDIRTQNVLYDLINSYIPNEFIKPRKWCELVVGSDNYCCELYAISAKYFAMIGEYDIADQLVDKGVELCNDPDRRILLFNPLEKMIMQLDKQKEDTNRYRTKKPYWPQTEERRRAVAMFYDEKGIKYPRIESRPEKISESEFAPINERYDDSLTDYCAFWCNEVFSLASSKCICQIAAVKVCNNETKDTFESYVRPWDSTVNARKLAAEDIGVPAEVIEAADDVDIVLSKFFEFVGDSVLVSTGALGNQAKLISRAARYSGMKQIKNKFFDLLDFAADVSSDFDLANNTREYLLSAFNIAEGKTALEKALINKQIFDLLRNYGE